MRQRLVLVAPADVSPEALGAALSGGDVAAVVVDPAAADVARLVAVCQAAGAAALIGVAAEDGGPLPWPPARGADGVHAAGSVAALARVLETRPEGATVGVLARNRHDAMVFGEAGADYVWFGDTATLDEEAVTLACWWSRLFEVPCVVAGPCDDDAADSLAASNAEFIAVNVFQGAEDPAERVAAVDGRLARRARGA